MVFSFFVLFTFNIALVVISNFYGKEEWERERERKEEIVSVVR